MTNVGVIVFPGTNCEMDAVSAVETAGGVAEFIWHGEKNLGDVDAVIVPGGFAHGDYLRSGAIARFSPVMEAVVRFAAEGGPVLGICNGFQVLAEAGLVPGALQKNAGLKFVCKPVKLMVESTSNVVSTQYELGQELTIPINHFEGNYTVDSKTLHELEDNKQVFLRYVDNPNGSVASIAGVSNRAGNVVGLMPHPERASNTLLGSADGLPMFVSLLTNSFVAS
ncbi:MAG: phosphoribosylformylglycinamidine synthase subunit PurQ [Actinomycetota bacterium]|nr:phosphoribosylformylglycinamidine synthase subunit PurQ [Actinomycetota bacterium]